MGKDAAKLTISKVITLIITLLTNMLLSRLRTLTEYGTFSQILMVVNLIVAIFSLGLPNSINYFIPKSSDDDEKKEFLSNFFSANTVLSIVSGCLLVSCLPFICAYFKNNEITKFWFALAILPWCLIVQSSVSNLLIVYGKSNKLLLYNFISALLLFGAVLLVELLNLTFFHYMIFYICAEVILCLWVYVIAFKLAKGLVLSLNWNLLRTILVFSIPLGVASSISTLNSELDKFIIGKLMATEQVALYTNAAKELPISIIPSSFTAILMPHIVKDMHDNKNSEAIKKWALGIEMGYIFVCFTSMVCISYAPQIMTILYSEKYLPGVQVFRIYSAVLLLRATYFGMILNCSGKTKFVFYTTLMSLVLNCFLNYLFFNIFGFVGPAIATFVSIFCIQFVQLYFSSKIINISFTKIFPWKKLAIISLINIGLGITSYGIIRFFGWGTSLADILKSIILGIGIAGIYLFVEKNNVKKLWYQLNEE